MTRQIRLVLSRVYGVQRGKTEDGKDGLQPAKNEIMAKRDRKVKTLSIPIHADMLLFLFNIIIVAFRKHSQCFQLFSTYDE